LTGSAAGGDDADVRTALALLCVVVSALAAGCGEEAGPAATAAPPAATTSGATSETALTVNRLPDLALQLSELPAGFSVRREDFVDVSGDVVGEFRRSFDPGDATLGESRLADLSSDVALFRNEQVAGAALATILAALLGDQVEQAFAGIVRAAAGIEATNIEGETLVTRDLGDSAIVARATFDTDAGRAEAVYLVVHVGRLHHALFLIGPAGSVSLVDARALAEAVLPRLEEAAGGRFAA